MNSITRYSRRDLVSFGAVAGGIVLSGLPSAGTAAAREAESREETISANEDLMREHGVLRRVLIVYSRAANLLRNQSGKADLAALGDAAKLFREFGQQYHERTLEEEYVFPALRRSGGDVSRLVGVLIDQHRRGEEITGYILSVSGRGEIGEGEAGPLAKALDSLVRMYNAHTAWEDTVLFPAWTKTMSPGATRRDGRALRGA